MPYPSPADEDAGDIVAAFALVVLTAGPAIAMFAFAAWAIMVACE